MNWDYNLFLWLNFDGGLFMDFLMLFASSKLGWAPLYLVVLYMTGRKVGWRRMLLLLAVIACAVGLADIFCGIFKHSGPLKYLIADFPARLRPMYVEEFIGQHVHKIYAGGQYGTISAHAATSTAIAIISAFAVNRKWMSIVLAVQVALVCYSRIYLAYHFPQDILLGIAVGIASAAIMIFIGLKIERLLPPIGTK